MDKKVVLSNEELKVVVSSLGAELQSVKRGDLEYIWIADPTEWKSHAPLLFPIIGSVKDDKFIHNGKEYNLQYHGFGRFQEFELESYTEQEAVFLHCFNEETFKVFPFKYELRIAYILQNSSLKIEYRVKNLDGEEMFFSIGSHEGYYCPEGVEEYSVIFEKPEELDFCLTSGGLIDYKTENIGSNITEFPLKYEYFQRRSLIFLNLKSKEVSLVNRNSGKKTTVTFDENHTTFTLWTSPGKHYMCLEPWCGVPDFVDTDYNIKNKKGIIRLAGHEETVITHEITFTI